MLKFQCYRKVEDVDVDGNGELLFRALPDAPGENGVVNGLTGGHVQINIHDADMLDNFSPGGIYTITDAHAGWPVLITLAYGEPTGAKSISTERVEPYTERTFYVNSGCGIVHIEECTESWAAKPTDSDGDDGA